VNFLAHLALSGEEPEILVGNLMGDFVKGRLEGRFPPGIRQGIELHRKIDSFAGQNEFFIRSKQRIDARFGLYRGVLVDLYYDHFLALNWQDYGRLPLQQFIDNASAILEEHREMLPERLQLRLAELFSDWLPSYLELDGIDRVLKRMSARLKRANPLGDGVGELKRNYGALEEDFRRFFPQLRAYAADFRGEKVC
jgi:acyl carrier protein phosphodiesterase